jgi:hypothetical protein
MKHPDMRTQNLREAITNLEYLVEFEEEPGKKRHYQAQLDEFRKQLNAMSKATG